MTRSSWFAAVLALAGVPIAGALWAGHTADATPRATLPAARAAAVTSRTRSPAPSASPLAPPPQSVVGADKAFIGIVIPAETVELAARIDGRVERVHVRVGERLEAGAKIVSFDTGALRRELATLRAGVEVLSAEAERSSVGAAEAASLFEHRRAAAASELPAVSGEELASARYRAEEATLGMRVAEARVLERLQQVAQVQQQIDDAEIRAPFRCAVAERFVDPGASVQLGALLVRVVSGEEPRLRFAVPPEELERVGPGAPVTASIDGDPLVLSAVVENVSPEVEVASRMNVAHARFLDPVNEALRAKLIGRIARVRLSVTSLAGGEP